MTTQQPWPWPDRMDALLVFVSAANSGSSPGLRVRWMEPEGPHSVENIDEHRYHAIRVELK
jgi:hypothetical protein